MGLAHHLGTFYVIPRIIQVQLKNLFKISSSKKMHTWGVRLSNRILLISMYFLIFSPNYEHPEVKPQTSPISKLPLSGVLFTEVISAAAIFAKGGMLINHRFHLFNQ